MSGRKLIQPDQIAFSSGRELKILFVAVEVDYDLSFFFFLHLFAFQSFRCVGGDYRCALGFYLPFLHHRGDKDTGNDEPLPLLCFIGLTAVWRAASWVKVPKSPET